MSELDARRRTLSLDPIDERAWLGGEPLRLTPRAFALLRHLVANRDRLVTKGELFERVWNGTTVGDSALTTTVREVRRALGESSRRADFIQTVHGRGYRFIGPLSTPDGLRPASPRAAAPLFGRETELALLQERFQEAEQGQRRMVFVTGEAGVGKTALIDGFLERVAGMPRARFARGQCVELFGAAEAYLPWLDVLGQLSRQREGTEVLALLRSVAPMWLAQLPAFVTGAERHAVLQEIAGAPPQRMLREMTDLLQALSADRPLVIALEDLHWGDRPSLELLALVARRREPAKLMVLGSYRPGEVSRSNHQLEEIATALRLQRRCDELALQFLSRSAVAEYVEAHFPGLPTSIAGLVYRRTDGNALFVVDTLEHLARRELIVAQRGRWELRGPLKSIETVVPESLQLLIESQLDRLDDDARRLVEVASVSGIELTDAALAPALDWTAEEVARRCDELVRQRFFLRAAGEENWPDGTPTRRYAFTHALYPEVLYAGLAPSSRLRIHRAIADRLEAGHVPRTNEIAAELAIHFERGGDPSRAVAHLAEAANNAMHRLAYAEAIALLEHALALLPSLPDGPERQRRELSLRMTLAPALMVTRGYAAPEVEGEYVRAEELCRRVGDLRETFNVLVGRAGPALLMARTEFAVAIARESLELARARGSKRYLTQAETSVGVTELWRGDLRSAAIHLEASRCAYESIPQAPPSIRIVHDPGAAGRAYAAWAFWMLGEPDRARDESRHAIALARRLAHPFSLAFALAFGAFVHQARGDVAATLEHAEETIRVCTEHGFAMYLAVGSVFRGWAMAEKGRIADGSAMMEEALTAYAATGAVLVQPYFRGLIADRERRDGHFTRARGWLDDALIATERTGERIYQAELHRLRGEVDWEEMEAARPDENERRIVARSVEERLRRALAIARSNHAASIELRVAISLARLGLATGRPCEEDMALRDVFRRFTEGLDTPDLLEAAALLRGAR